MHGLIFRTIEVFVCDNFGADRWGAALRAADLDIGSFEAMLNYSEECLPKLLDGCAQVLGRDVSVILEDIGTHLVTHGNYVFVRRLMRFGGHNFIELLHSLDELPDRTRLVVPGLELPAITVYDHTEQQFTIECRGGPLGFGHILVGILRAMADDYGALTVLEHLGAKSGTEVIEVSVFDVSFAEDRGFSLAHSKQGQTA